jgi:hypothetical protein
MLSFQLSELLRFLDARINEEIDMAVAARSVAPGTWTGSQRDVSAHGQVVAVAAVAASKPVVDHVVRYQPDNTLVDLTLHKKITFRLREAARALDACGADSSEWCAAQAEISGLVFAVRALAVRYKDHPDYDHDWIPSLGACMPSPDEDNRISDTFWNGLLDPSKKTEGKDKDTPPNKD